MINMQSQKQTHLGYLRPNHRTANELIVNGENNSLHINAIL